MSTKYFTPPIVKLPVSDVPVLSIVIIAEDSSAVISGKDGLCAQTPPSCPIRAAEESVVPSLSKGHIKF
jgi:hypothetical protein